MSSHRITIAGAIYRYHMRLKNGWNGNDLGLVWENFAVKKNGADNGLDGPNNPKSNTQRRMVCGWMHRSVVYIYRHAVLKYYYCTTVDERHKKRRAPLVSRARLSFLGFVIKDPCKQGESTPTTDIY